ncbi:MAG TPA: DNRLRE domain-containing protein [Polyangiaceae bacterium]|nr:DNRLRE domain-containing protein [Polyangiaceae bacterium]
MADATLRAGEHADTTYGAVDGLQAKSAGDDSKYTRITAIEFDMSAVSGNPSLARLWVYGSTDGADVRVAAVPLGHNGTWDEASATWNNVWQPVAQPVFATEVYTEVPVVTFTHDEGWQYFDMATYMDENIAAGLETVTVYLIAEANSPAVVNLSSREVGRNASGASSPYMMIGTPYNTPTPGGISIGKGSSGCGVTVGSPCQGTPDDCQSGKTSFSGQWTCSGSQAICELEPGRDYCDTSHGCLGGGCGGCGSPDGNSGDSCEKDDDCSPGSVCDGYSHLCHELEAAACSQLTGYCWQVKANRTDASPDGAHSQDICAQAHE